MKAVCIFIYDLFMTRDLCIYHLWQIILGFINFLYRKNLNLEISFGESHEEQNWMSNTRQLSTHQETWITINVDPQKSSVPEGSK